MAASLGSALADAFDKLRQEDDLDANHLIDEAIRKVRCGRSLAVHTPSARNFLDLSPQAEDRLVQAVIVALAKSGFITRSDSKTSTTPKVGLLSERIDAFLSQMKIQGRSETNLLDTRFTLRLFLGLVGDKDLGDIGPTDLDIFMDGLGRWPANASRKPRYRSQSPKDVLKEAKRHHDKTLAPRTKEKHLDRLRVFFNNCTQRRLLTYNPCAGLRITNRDQDEQETRQPFSEQDLRIIFDSQRFKYSIPHKHWAPILALYSGMRLNEIGQLKTDDLEQIDGIWGLHVRHQVKNLSSRRFIPLHPSLVTLGFVEYVQDAQVHGFDLVFPGLPWGVHGPGDSIGDWFNRTYLRKVCKITDPAKVFHSFRGLFASLGERSGLSDYRIARLTGHSTGSSVLRRHYIQPATLLERAEDIARIRFPVLDIPIPPKGCFDLYFKRVKALEARKQRNKLRVKSKES
jgi:integrase